MGFRTARPIRLAMAAVVAVVTPLLATPAAAEPLRDQQWYLDRIGIRQAHAAVEGDGVLVGMFLSSVDAGHPDLGGQVRPGRYVGSGGEVKERPAELDTAAGRDVDTALAGLVVARGGDGVLGVAPRAQIQPISGPVGEEKVSQALRWLVDQGAQVIDMSGGFTVDGDVESIDGVRYALAQDVVVIMDARRADRLPGSASTGVLVVGGITAKDERDGAASFDSRIDLSAPGATLGLVGLAAGPSPDRRYAPIAAQGDMQASAIVAGVAALVRARHPQLNAASVIDRLLGTAQDLGPAGPDRTFGAGVVDAAAAVTTERPVVVENPLGDPGPPSVGLLDRVGGVALLAGALCCLVAVLAAVGVALSVARRRRR
ncbi:S8 family serine peptidase [Micromonospora sp. CA-263727]|uniref:S8 family serine peptidase n=1 Tax=Micromonospora sp. CA-263727 TaxID=3239967 RepID=UPI003D8C5F41